MQQHGPREQALRQLVAAVGYLLERHRDYAHGGAGPAADDWSQLTVAMRRAGYHEADMADLARTTDRAHLEADLVVAGHSAGGQLHTCPAVRQALRDLDDEQVDA